MYKTTLSAFKQHERCPHCNSKDNLARYDDGHAWCFGCGHYEAGERVAQRPVATQVETKKDTPSEDTIRLPSDATTTLDNRALNWLHAYGITRPEIIANDLRWSNAREQLIFPVYEGNTLLLYQTRNFKAEYPKWLTYGKAGEILHILGLTNEANCGIVLVEDMVSAMKVSRYLPAMPLFGNNCSARQLVRLNRITDRVIIWLDPDMKKRSHWLASAATEVGLKVKVIHSNCDPKEESDERIKLACEWNAATV